MVDVSARLGVIPPEDGEALPDGSWARGNDMASTITVVGDIGVGVVLYGYPRGHAGYE
jgi:hypothetical protein